ncbi:MAG: CopG family transcriptional regulator, nickel-responsive regulator [Synergistaceae bacterium]|jgi:CopG family nickel-responsive transcriptional regulator|nr:CopG family transcriptional regulator, nickel-responsive regulator [Synergistaceae bacterium]
MEELVRFSVSVPEQLLEEFDRWLSRSGMHNRSEAVRQVMRSFIAQSQWEERSGEVFGTVTIIYDHHRNDAVSSLTELQHHFSRVIICTTHVHIDPRRCLEVIVLRGEVEEMRRFITSLSSLKGIEETHPVITSPL